MNNRAQPSPSVAQSLPLRPAAGLGPSRAPTAKLKPCAKCGALIWPRGSLTKCVPCRLNWTPRPDPVLGRPRIHPVREAKPKQPKQPKTPSPQAQHRAELKAINTAIKASDTERAGKAARLAAIRAAATARQQRAMGL